MGASSPKSSGLRTEPSAATSKSKRQNNLGQDFHSDAAFPFRRGISVPTRRDYRGGKFHKTRRPSWVATKRPSVGLSVSASISKCLFFCGLATGSRCQWTESNVPTPATLTSRSEGNDSNALNRPRISHAEEPGKRVCGHSVRQHQNVLR